MTKAVLGKKRTCRKCSAIFYDLCRDPIVCPKCSSTFSESDFVVKAKNSDSFKKRSEKKVVALDEIPIAAGDKTFDESLLTDDLDSDVDVEIEAIVDSSESEYEDLK